MSVADTVPVCASHRKLFYAVCAAFFTAGVVNVSIEWSIAPLARDLALSDGQLSIVAAGFAFGRCSGPMLMLYLLDIWGRRNTVLLCIGGASVVQIVIAGLAGSGWAGVYVLAGLRAALGLCTGGVTVTSKTYLIEMIPNEIQAEWINYVHMALQVGSILFTACFSLFNEPSWHLTAAATAIPGLLLIAVLSSSEVFPESAEYLSSAGDTSAASKVLNTLAERGGVRFNVAAFRAVTGKCFGSPQKKQSDSASVWTLLKPPFVVLVVCVMANQFCYRFAQNGNDTWAMSFLDNTGRADERFGAASSKFACKILGGFLAAAFSSRLGMLPMLIGGYGLCAAGTLLFAMSTGSWGSMAGLGLAYLGEEISSVLGMTFMIQAFPTALRGRGSSIASAPSGLAGSLAGMTGALRPIDERLPFVVNAVAMICAASILVIYKTLR